MANLTITKTVEFNEPLTEEEVLDKIRECLKKEFSGVRVKKRKNQNPRMKACVKTKLFNPIVSLAGPVDIQIKDDKAKIMIDADTKANLWFWFMVLVGMWLIVPILLMFWMWPSQKKHSMESLQRAFERFEFEQGKF